MSSVAEIHPWTIHLSRQDDEFAAKCGANYKGMLVTETKEGAGRYLLGYKLCEKCEEENARSA